MTFQFLMIGYTGTIQLTGDPNLASQFLKTGFSGSHPGGLGVANHTS
jgi:hypothetical protein